MLQKQIYKSYIHIYKYDIYRDNTKEVCIENENLKHAKL